MTFLHKVASGYCWLRVLFVRIMKASECACNSGVRLFAQTIAMFKASFFDCERQLPAANWMPSDDMAGAYHHVFGNCGLQVGGRIFRGLTRMQTACLFGPVRRTVKRRLQMQLEPEPSVCAHVATSIASLGTAIGEIACKKKSLVITREIRVNSLY